MTIDQAFIQAIIAHPDDDAYRLVYADWLEEHGDIDRATFIRLQCELARILPTDERFPALDAQERALRKAHFEEWIAPLRSACPFYKARSEFRRGFVEFVRVSGSSFLERGADLFRLSPIRRLAVEVDFDTLPRFADAMSLRFLSELQVTTYTIRDRTGSQICPLLASPFTGNLKRLAIGGCMIGARATSLLLDQERLGRLVDLGLLNCYIPAEFANQLRQAYGDRCTLPTQRPEWTRHRDWLPRINELPPNEVPPELQAELDAWRQARAQAWEIGEH